VSGLFTPIIKSLLSYDTGITANTHTSFRTLSLSTSITVYKTCKTTRLQHQLYNIHNIQKYASKH